MRAKEEKLKPRLLECIDRMKSLVINEAPGVVVGLAAYQIFAAALSVYGSVAYVKTGIA